MSLSALRSEEKRGKDLTAQLSDPLDAQKVYFRELYVPLLSLHYLLYLVYLKPISINYYCCSSSYAIQTSALKQNKSLVLVQVFY